jgi:hypothetical protein
VQAGRSDALGKREGKCDHQFYFKERSSGSEKFLTCAGEKNKGSHLYE